jgi:hypothetical protein
MSASSGAESICGSEPQPALCGTRRHVMAEKKESDERFKKFGTVSFTSLT